MTNYQDYIPNNDSEANRLGPDNADYEWEGTSTGPNSGTRANYTANDPWLYNQTSRQHRMLDWTEFKTRYGGFEPDEKKLKDEYDKYTISFDAKQENMQNQATGELDDTYWADLQNFVESQPGYEAYAKYIPEYLQRMTDLQNGQMDPYTGQLTVDQNPTAAGMMKYLEGQLFGGIDQKYEELGGMFRNVKAEFLPAMDQNFKEGVQDPLQQQLADMGMTNSTPGMEMNQGVNQDYAIQRAQAGARMDMDFASQMMGVEQARASAWGQAGAGASSLMAFDESRQRTNQGVQYQDWLTHQNDPYTRLGLGGNAMNTSAGALSTSAGQGIQAASIPYEQGNSYLMGDLDWARMGPLYEKMAQPIDSGGGKK